MSVERFAKKEILAMDRGTPASRRSVSGMEGLINLGAGDPDFNQPEFINKAVYEAMRDGHTHYAFGGDPDFKESIAEYYKKYGVDVDPKTQIVIESGGSQAIFRSFGAILNPGDEIIIMDPAYQGYQKPADYFGAKMVRANLTKDEKGILRPDMENISAAINDMTKALLICNPDNPSGAVYTQEELEEIAEIAVERDIVVIADEIYTEFVWGGRKHRPIINLPGMAERTMVLMSFSKTFAWTGNRAGFIISSPEMTEIVNAVPTGTCGVPVPFQKAGIVALEKGWDFVEEMRRTYEERIEYVVPRINEIEGVSCPYPEGAFYAFCDISSLGIKSADFVEKLLKEEKLRASPGTQYGANGEGYFRLALVRPIEVLEEACRRIERMVKRIN